MTYNEIIKTLECLCGVGDSCAECAYHKKYRFAECRKQVAKDALDLITRQQTENKRLEKEVNLVSIEFQDLQERYEEAQTEIERLKIENQAFLAAANSYKLHYNEAITEAVKEFAVRLKCGVPQETGVIRCSDIDNLVKEIEEKYEIS